MVYVIRLHTTTTCRQLGNDTTYDTEKKNPTSHDVADTSAVSGRRVGKTRHHVVKINCRRHLKKRHFQLSKRKKRLASQDYVERRVPPKRNAKQPTSYRDFNDNNGDDGDELDSDTIDSVLLYDEDGDLNDDDDNSHDELDIDMNDSDLQSNEDGDEASSLWPW